VIIRGQSTEIAAAAAHGAHRFVHIDASHVYDTSRRHRHTKALLATDGVVAFDDFRGEITPGVSAAVWQAVRRRGPPPHASPTASSTARGANAAMWRERLLSWLPGRGIEWRVTTAG